ncbi:polyprenyl synthetase family protein [Spartinivicinus ruber]|uniref:polyprenyl synthetase family protein n=1 Tax=Spartinivicinus ruber TaxID=2683272 RepID=UPI0013D7964B|nr:polyprenyl synthetase family protein [Spartinivicinus ruber]
MSQANLLKRIYQTVKQDFSGVNDQIISQLHSDVSLVDKISHYITEAGGKRLRPLLVLLSAKACQYQQQDHIPLAAIIEFLHTATLLHDDVVDTSKLRRGRATVNAIWGNAPSVLVGDFLYSRAFQMMVKLGNLQIMRVLADATNVIAEGEVMQLMNIGNAATTEADYLEVIRCKTAMLFEASSQTAAILANSSTEQENNLRQYGYHLGMAFQLIDDVLDFQGSVEEMGKNVGDDLAEGKPTLPLIHTIESGSSDDAKLVKDAIENPSQLDLEAVISAVKRSGALAYTQSLAEQQADLAIKCITDLPDSEHKQAMVELAHFSVNRSY